MQKNRFTNATNWIPVLALLGLTTLTPLVWGQYIGFVYPAGGQQGSTFPIKLGGQALEPVQKVFVSGEGVSIRVMDVYRNLGNQELGFLRTQLSELQRGKSTLSSDMVSTMLSMEVPPAIVAESFPTKTPAKTMAAPKTDADIAKQKLIDKLQKRLGADSRRPASRALSELVFAEVMVAPDAKPGVREIRVATSRGVSNPMVFCIGQVPEVARKAMKTADQQVLGKEYLAKRNRPQQEEEVTIKLPCTMNGQIASGEVNRYRFEARKGQRLIMSVRARELVPFIADSVPGWFQPVLTLRDAAGKELAYDDDFRFKPDPVIQFSVPADGECVLSINDALYRGREDFIYRITIGETPFVTSVFPLGRRMGEPVKVEMNGWNLDKATLEPPAKDAEAAIHLITASRDGFVSNPVPFAVDTLPECMENETNDNPAKAQKVTLPIILNGRINRPDDTDIFEVEGRSGEILVAEVYARRLDSPVDSFLKVTDAKGTVLGFNDDHQDAASGLNTHHADSYLMIKLPADGKYFVHLTDTSRAGGKDYGYRLRISPPRPDFELRVVPPSIAIRSKSSAAVSVYALRKDGFAGPIKLKFQNLPAGFSSTSILLEAGKDMVRLALKNSTTATDAPVTLKVVGSAKIDSQDIVHSAVPAEDRMQAFLWRHLLPAQELVAWVYSSSSSSAPVTQVRTLPPIPADAKPALKPGEAPKFTEKQVAGLRRQLERLYQEWYLTDDFTGRELAKLQTSN